MFGGVTSKTHLKGRIKRAIIVIPALIWHDFALNLDSRWEIKRTLKVVSN